MSVLSRFKPCSHLTLKYSLCSAVNNRNLSIFFKYCSSFLRNIGCFTSSYKSIHKSYKAIRPTIALFLSKNNECKIPAC